MKTGFEIDFRHSAGNLHVYAKGEFNDMCAWELIKTIKRRYNGSGRVFVNTAGLDKVMPDGIRLFKEHITPEIMPLNKLYIKGETGFKIGPNGSRVIICRKKKTAVPRRFKRSVKNKSAEWSHPLTAKKTRCAREQNQQA